MRANAGTAFPIDSYSPVNREHPLNKDRLFWFLTLPHLAGSQKFYDLMGGIGCLIANRSGEAGWGRSANPGGYGSMKFVNAVANAVVYNNFISPRTFTISGWFFRQDNVVAYVMCSADNNVNTTGWRVRTNASEQLLLSYAGVADYAFTTLKVPNGVWTWVCIVVDGNLGTGYVSNSAGSLIAQSRSDLGVFSATSKFSIGSNTHTVRLLGAANDVSLHTRALKRDEVFSLYQQSAAGHPDTLTRLTPHGIVTNEHSAIFPELVPYTVINPTGLAGLAYWFEGDALTNPGSGQPITQWSNMGYLGSIATSPVGAAQRPIFQSGLNGHAYADFRDKLGYRASISSASGGQFVGYTAFCVRNVFAPSGDLWESRENAVGRSIGGQMMSTSGMFGYNSPRDFGASFPTSPFLSFNHASGEWGIRTDVYASGNNSFYMNGNLLGRASGGYYTPTGFETVIFGLGINVNSNVNAPNAQIAEILIYDHLLASGEIEGVNNFLKQKYFVGGGGGIPLTMRAGIDPATSSCPLYIGSILPASSSMKLYIGSILPSSGARTLYTAGNLSANNSETLYVRGASGSFRTAPLFVEGAQFGFGSMNMYILSRPTPATSSHVPLFSFASTGNVSSMFKTEPLFIKAGTTTPGLPLFMKGPDKGTLTSSLPMFLKALETSGAPHSFTTFFLKNTGGTAPSGARLFVEGDGVMDGAFIGGGALPLYMERWPNAGISLVVRSTTTTQSSTLYTFGGTPPSGSRNLFVRGGNQPTASSLAPMFLKSAQVLPSSVRFYIQGKPVASSHFNFYTSGF